MLSFFFRFSPLFLFFLLLLFNFTTDAQRYGQKTFGKTPKRGGKADGRTVPFGGQRQSGKMPMPPFFANGRHRNGRRRIDAIPRNLLFPPGTPQAAHGSLGAIWTNEK